MRIREGEEYREEFKCMVEEMVEEMMEGRGYTGEGTRVDSDGWLVKG